MVVDHGWEKLGVSSWWGLYWDGELVWVSP